ncbi:hypothetical protein [Spirosoma utsteinense]|uniref:hypothetical protein n=1 Tax=Spirosoma utsteinense TaxID=2585773 RepID=UPI001649303D|nr:hypothetical protein [Spirosoma utsteinense]MBC3785707.1 hypothetical protein [Spirosoma utsteinense]
MNEFLQAAAKLFTGFPPVLIVVLAPLFGSLVTLLVTTNQQDLKEPMKLIARFVAGWLTGAFLGPVVSPGIQAIVKAPDFSLGFLSGLGGYLSAKRIIKNKQIELDDNQPKAPGNGLQS